MLTLIIRGVKWKGPGLGTGARRGDPALSGHAVGLQESVDTSLHLKLFLLPHGDTLDNCTTQGNRIPAPFCCCCSFSSGMGGVGVTGGLPPFPSPALLSRGLGTRLAGSGPAPPYRELPAWFQSANLSALKLGRAWWVRCVLRAHWRDWMSRDQAWRRALHSGQTRAGTSVKPPGLAQGWCDLS